MIGNTNASTLQSWVIKNLSEIPSGHRILDAGAGELIYKQHCTHLDYISQDFAEYDGVGDGVGLQNKTWDYTGVDIISDIVSIPEPDDSFDAILCSEVLEHVPHPVEAILELDRLLRVGGVLLITAPFASLVHQSPYYFYSGFADNFYRRWLKGYDVDITYNGNYYEWLGQELNRLCGSGAINTPQVLLDELATLSSKDTGSHALLCYGLMVKAIKR